MSSDYDLKYRFLSDNPLEVTEEDAFEHDDFSQVLVEIIQSCETPCNLGLFGNWGTGKTTILNRVSEKLNTHDLKNKFDYLYLDAWKFNKENLRQQILLELNKKYCRFPEEDIENMLYNIRQVERKKIAGSWDILANFLTNNWISIVVFFISLCIFHEAKNGVAGLDIAILRSLTLPLAISVIKNLDNVLNTVQRTAKISIPRIEHPNQFEKIFKEILTKKKKKRVLVVAIDNLDRSESEVVVDTISTIKTFMDVSGCTFIIACDDDALVKHLQATKGKEYDETDAREFLRKFLQMTISIPPFIARARQSSEN